MTDVVVTNDDRHGRFEARVDGMIAELLYRVTDDRLVLVHTEVPSELEGRGIAGALVVAALDYAKRFGLTVVPRCPFARAWLEGHPGVAERAQIEWPDASPT